MKENDYLFFQELCGAGSELTLNQARFLHRVFGWKGRVGVHS